MNNPKYLPLLIFIFPLFLQAQVEELPLVGTWDDEAITESGAFTPYNEIWGTVVNGEEYAIIASVYGFHFISLADPTQPEEVVRVQGSASGNFIIHRDFHSMGNILFSVADEGSSSRLEVTDMSLLPDTVHTEFMSDFPANNIHNIYLDEDNQRLYFCAFRDTADGYDALAIADVSDPFNPELIFRGTTIDGTNLEYVHDMHIVNDTAFFNCGNRGLVIADMTDIDSPKVISTLEDYPEKGYNHSGWYVPEKQAYYMADETHNADMKAVDVSDPATPQVVDLFGPGSNAPDDTVSIPHNPLVNGDYLHISYYYDGYRVYDIGTDPLEPELVGYYQTSLVPNSFGFSGAWGVYPFLPSGNILVSDIERGLFVIEGPSETTSTNQLSQREEIICYPNPAGDFITVVTRNKKSDIKVYNASGQVVLTQNSVSGKTRMNLSNLSSGVYFLVTTTENGEVKREKIIHY